MAFQAAAKAFSLQGLRREVTPLMDDFNVCLHSMPAASGEASLFIKKTFFLYPPGLTTRNFWFNQPAISASEWILPASPGTCSIAVAKLVFMDAITFSTQAQMSVLTVPLW